METEDMEEERPYKRIKLSMEVDDPVDLFPDYKYLPDIAVEQIFRYLNLRDLGQVAQVCKQWYFLSRRCIFWRRVDTQCLSLDSRMTERLLNILPVSVTHLRLNVARVQCLSLPHVAVLLRNNCPNLEVLWLNDARINYTTGISSISFVLEVFPSNLRMLILRHSSFVSSQCMKQDKTFSPSRIEVLDVARSYELGRDALTMASMMPKLWRLCLSGCTVVDSHFQPYYRMIGNLRELDLEGTLITSRTFRAVWHYGLNLRELYMCNTCFEDRDLPYKRYLPFLEILCLRNTELTWTGVQYISESFPQLKCLIISIPFKCPSWTKHGFSEKIIQINDSSRYCDHFAICNYMRPESRLKT